MGDREKTADRERSCNRDAGPGQTCRALLAAGLAFAVPAMAAIAVAIGPAQACFLGIPSR